jgi:replicative superfamily II helicase
LLIHLIKQAAEQRTTRSWDYSIANAAEEIQYVNKRRKSGGYYLNSDELKEVIAEAYQTALRKAALEAFEGQYTTEQLANQVNPLIIQNNALKIIAEINK